jgi:Spy/CpxP family protein refolding chaperone
MRKLFLLALVITAVGLGGAVAQQHDAQQHAGHSPYADQEMSEVPSLTQTQLEQLRNGDGMGLALPAELNHFPGPKHVLEFADDLELTTEQTTRTEEVFVEMQTAARALGAEIIEAEAQLNRRFEHSHIDAKVLREQTAKIAGLYGRLRFTHLNAHLQMTELLSEKQVAAYDRLRGYAHQ